MTRKVELHTALVNGGESRNTLWDFGGRPGPRFWSTPPAVCCACCCCCANGGGGCTAGGGDASCCCAGGAGTGTAGAGRLSALACGARRGCTVPPTLTDI
jgi:hypothetical protein